MGHSLREVAGGGVTVGGTGVDRCGANICDLLSTDGLGRRSESGGVRESWSSQKTVVGLV